MRPTRRAGNDSARYPGPGADGRGWDGPAGDAAAEVAGDGAAEVAGDGAAEVAGDGAAEVARVAAAEVAGDGAAEVARVAAAEVAGDAAAEVARVAAAEVAGDAAAEVAGNVATGDGRGPVETGAVVASAGDEGANDASLNGGRCAVMATMR